MNKSVMITGILVVVVGAGGFFAGIKYQQNKPGPTFRQVNSQGIRAGLGGNNTGNRQGFRPVNGDIIASDDKSITVKLTDGSSKIILLSDKTEINKADTATKTDLTVGTKVAVFGTNNTNGSVTAENIQVNPILRDIPNGTPSINQPTQ